MHNVLAAVDGSDHAIRAIAHLIKLKSIGAIQVVLLNVQPEPEMRALALHRDVIMSDLREAAEKALADARRQLDAAGIPYEERVEFGDVAGTIVRVAKEAGCEQIVMGTRGLGSIAGLLLGSVTTKVLHLADMPVTLVK
jgi:nucleotide-binding universal stress UspA family protein